MSACAAGLKPVHTVEGIKSYELDNGLVGSRMENYGETGMAHLL